MFTRDILYSRSIYSPPAWIRSFIPEKSIPHHRINLGNLPTPLHQLKLNGGEIGNGLDTILSTMSKFDFWIKRDDMSSFDLTGNKIRKLEFLLGRCY